MSSAFSSLRRSSLLWRAFWRALQPLRPACSRSATFLWLFVVLAGLCLRPDLAGVTSLVRGLGLSGASYYCLRHFFHSPALDVAALTQLWQKTLQWLLRRRWVRVHGRRVALESLLPEARQQLQIQGGRMEEVQQAVIAGLRQPQGPPQAGDPGQIGAQAQGGQNHHQPEKSGGAGNRPGGAGGARARRPAGAPGIGRENASEKALTYPLVLLCYRV